MISAPFNAETMCNNVKETSVEREPIQKVYFADFETFTVDDK